MQRMGVDTGGTFTDFVFWQAGQLQIAKRLSTPHNPSEALLAEVAAHPAPHMLIHGTTVATNALLERRGAVTALITTAGFNDLLVIGRGDRPSLYEMHQQRPAPLVPDHLRLEVRERTTFDQQILIPLDDADIHALCPVLDAHGVTSIAVCLLHAYANPAHEQRIGAILHAYNPTWHVSLSHRIVNEAREYERTATTVVNAYVAPLMAHYLHDIATQLPRTTRLRVMASDGGSMGVATAQSLPARTTLSGPAGGIVGAFAVAQQLGIQRCISFDMGGTSTDVALCDGALPRSSGSAVGGLPVRLASLDIHTVGAGGGSLVRIDSGGALRVGPQSAGAHPGPACYGLGTLATVTDANVILGRLRPDAFLGGQMRLDRDRAMHALAPVAEALACDSITAALGTIRIVNAAMARAVRTISVERGHNPREFALIAFGGAGPLHAVQLAHELGIERVIVPRYPGVLSALGMVTAAVTRSATRAILQPLAHVTPAQLHTLIASTHAELTDALHHDGESPATCTHVLAMAMRYHGQVFELDVPLHPTSTHIPRIDAELLHQLAMRFHALHERRYGYALPERALEVVQLQHTMASAATPLPVPPPTVRHTPLQPRAYVHAYLNDNTQAGETAVYHRTDLCAGDAIYGPAIITQLDATTVIPADWYAVVTAVESLDITRRIGAEPADASTDASMPEPTSNRPATYDDSPD